MSFTSSYTRKSAGATAAGMILSVIGLMISMSLLFALPVMLLWNWLMPEIFGLTTLTFFQSWGLMMLCALLFNSSSSSVKS